ncbi:MAG: BrnT family toxin [Thermodesulfovibrionales bacterium]
MGILSSVEGFDWDEGNIKKDWERQRVTHIECEEVFFNNPLVAKHDKPHSATEDRYYVLGKTDNERLLFVVFTIMSNRIRVISARDMNRKEGKIYQNLRVKKKNLNSGQHMIRQNT